MEQPLIDGDFLLHKLPDKGGWTYTTIPEIPKNIQLPFGWVKVKGSIDGIAFRNYHMMPMKGTSKMFLPVKAGIRKKIGKKEGDWVHVVLHHDDAPAEIPDEFLICLQEDADVYRTFLKLPEGEKKAMIEWIYAAKHEDTKVERMARAMNEMIGK